MEIRRATVTDIADVIRFHEKLYIDYINSVTTESQRSFSAMKKPATVLKEDVDYMLRHPKSFAVFLAEQEDVVGYISGHVDHDPRRHHSKKGVVGDWYVAPTYRGSGQGATLMKALEDWFRSQNCSCIESSTWSDNQLARAAHSALGFEDARITMRKKL